MKKIAFLTYDKEPQLTDDDQLCFEPLHRLGYSINPLIWDACSGGDLDTFDAIIFRSCWNYHLKIEKFRVFLKMLESLKIPILNSLSVVEWNIEKKYLLNFQDKGFLIPKTVFIDPKTKFDLAATLKCLQISEAVLKPAISADGFETKRIKSEEAKSLQIWMDQALKSRCMIIQEFIPAILTEGEISFLFFNGVFSHAVRKRPTSDEFRIQSQYGGTRELFDPDLKTLNKAKQILAAAEKETLYARVDVIPVGDELILIELEMIDPFLYLSHSNTAPEQFAQAIHQRISKK